MSKLDISGVKEAYAWLKKDLLLLQVRYDLYHGHSYNINLMNQPDYRRFLKLMHIVSDLATFIRSFEPNERRKNDQQVFDDRRL